MAVEVTEIRILVCKLWKLPCLI